MIYVLIILTVLYIILLISGHQLTIRSYEILSDKISSEVRIAQISDLHGNSFGENNNKLLAKIIEQKPDVIVFTGDIFKDKLPIDGVKSFIPSLAESYPCFYVYGNHELRYDIKQEVIELLSNCGVTILDGEKCDVVINGQSIQIFGVVDPRHSVQNFFTQLEELNIIVDDSKFSVLLSHRPEYAKTYTEYNFDLVLSGHAHGGQWRIPGLINGLFVPNQGFFPKYAGGRYDFEAQTLIVSRGLATQYIVPRIFNPTELVIVDLVPNL